MIHRLRTLAELEELDCGDYGPKTAITRMKKRAKPSQLSRYRPFSLEYSKSYLGRGGGKGRRVEVERTCKDVEVALN